MLVCSTIIELSMRLRRGVLQPRLREAGPEGGVENCSDAGEG